MATPELNEILIYILIALIGWFMKTLHKRTERLEREMETMRANYISRFDDAKTDRFNMQTSIIDLLSKIDKKLDVYIAKSDKN